MKRILFTFLGCLLLFLAKAQPKPKPKQPSPTDMNKMLEEAMKAEGMSKEEQAEMKKMMEGVMPALQEHNATIADYPEFTSNQQLVPKKDPVKIASMSKKTLTKSEVGAYASTLYNKMLAKADATQMALVKKIVAQTPKASDIGNASILALLQGHPYAALALSIKAVQADPAILNWQNNMASLLTQYGYPEQAVPLLRKLKNEIPYNSSVLNNLGQAWLGLGETDSAKRYFDIAYRVNPKHPEAKLCGGLMEELKGDPVKAGENYTEALENSLNPFSEQLLKNHDKNYSPTSLDFEKIKKSIAIYEYFPKDWMPPPPALSNNVKNYNEDYATKKAYEKMVTSLTEKIETLNEELSRDLDNTFNKGEDAFINEMAKETMKGLSFMSKPAVIVLGVLGSYQAKWSLDHAEEIKKLTFWKDKLNTERQAAISKIYQQIADSKGTRCEQFKASLDAIENEYMQKVNTRIREYLLKKTEEYRQWLNAYVTWNWYVAGNTKNVILIQDLGFTAHLAATYSLIVESMETLGEHCNPKTYDVKKKFDAPEIPNFSCPAVVSIPAGAEWQQLVAAGKDFNKNNYGIKKTDKPVPNASIGFGAGNSIAQPGIAPFIKTANGSITPGGISTDDDELTPLTKIEKDWDITPLPNIPLDELVPLPDLRKSKLAKDLLNKMLTADCKNVKTPKQNLKDQLDRMMKSVKELEAYENVIEQIKKLEAEIEQKETDAQKKELQKKQIEKMWQETQKMDRYEDVQQSRKEIEKIMKEMDAMDEKKFMKEKFDKIMIAVDDMEATPAILKDIQLNGLQPSISGGLQSPGTFTPQKGLFN